MISMALINQFLPKTLTAAGIILRQCLELRAIRYQDVLDGYPQKVAEGIKVVDAGQSFPVLPFIDGLRRVKAKVLLQIRDRQSPGDTKGIDVPPGRDHVDGREILGTHEEASSGWSVKKVGVVNI